MADLAKFSGSVLKSNLWALLWLFFIVLLVQRQAQVWEPHLWTGDLGNLPYQCMRMCSGEVLYRDFAGKNPVGVFLIPFLIFKLLGPTIPALAWSTAVQFGLFLGAAYRLAKRVAPSCAWIVFPLSLQDCLVSCGLLHHLWAATVGLLAIPSLYDCLFDQEPEQAPRWNQAGLMLGLVGLFHQVLFFALGLAVVIASWTNSDGNRRATTLNLLQVAGVAGLTILCGYLLLALASGPDLSVVAAGLRSTTSFIWTHQSQPANNPWLFSDFLMFPPVQAGLDGLAVRALEILHRGLTYLGFPLLCLWTLIARRPRGSAPGPNTPNEDSWFAGVLLRPDKPSLSSKGSLDPVSWLLLSGALTCLAAFPQFGFVHIRAFVAPMSFVLLACLVEGQSGSWILAMLACLVSLLGIGDATVTLACQRVPVTLAVGTVQVSNPFEAKELAAISDELSRAEAGQTLLVYPYFPMAYFLFQKQNLFPIHEIYPGRILFHTGISPEHPLYQKGMQAAKQSPPVFAVQAIGIQRLFTNLERLQTETPDMQKSGQQNPLLDLIESDYVFARETHLEDGTPWLVLKKHKLISGQALHL